MSDIVQKKNSIKSLYQEGKQKKIFSWKTEERQLRCKGVCSFALGAPWGSARAAACPSLGELRKSPPGSRAAVAGLLWAPALAVPPARRR